jgi:hypothetical protein
VKFLDQAAFEQQRFRFVFYYMNIKVVNRVHQRVQLQIPTHAARRMEVLGDAFAEIARFADVNDGAKAILHQIDAGFVRQLAELVSDVIGRWHAASE